MKPCKFPVFAVVVLSLASAGVSVATPARAAEGCTEVEVQNVRPGQGMLMVAAYSDATTFNKTPLVAMQMPAGGETMSFTLCNLGKASVALTLYQDLNGNGKLDANVFGIPSEPWGASGKPAAMAAPTWDTTAVPLYGTTIVVKLSK